MLSWQGTECKHPQSYISAHTNLHLLLTASTDFATTEVQLSLRALRQAVPGLNQ